MNADHNPNDPNADRRDLDRALTEAGERWRATQPPPPEADTVQATIDAAADHRAAWLRSRTWAPVAAVAGVAAVLAVIVLPAALDRSGSEPGPGSGSGVGSGGAPGSHPPSPTFATEPDGVGRVGGTGSLLRNRNGEIWLCRDLITTSDLPTSTAGCGELHAIVTGVDEKWLVHTTTTGQAYSDPVRVEGTYRDGRLTVASVNEYTPDPPAPFTEPPVPCPAPAGGWRAGHGYTLDDPNNDPLNRLIETVRGRPAQFTDVWEGHPEGVPPGGSAPPVMVMVVGTTGDVASVRSELAAIFSGNICVHQVQYSASDLAEIAGRLRSGSPVPIGAEPLVIENRVRVQVIVLDRATSDHLDEVGRDAIILDEPLLQWLE